MICLQLFTNLLELAEFSGTSTRYGNQLRECDQQRVWNQRHSWNQLEVTGQQLVWRQLRHWI
jgi:hypothetical protein